MTDLSANEERVKARRANIAKRNRSELIFKSFGLAAVLVAAAFLLFLLSSIIYKAMPVLTYHSMSLPVDLTEKNIDPADIKGGDYSSAVKTALYETFPFIKKRKDKKIMRSLLSAGAPVTLQRNVINDPSIIGEKAPVLVGVSDTADLYLQGQQGELDKLDVSGALSVEADEKSVTLTAGSPIFDKIASAETEKLGSDKSSYFIFADGATILAKSITNDVIAGELLTPFKTAVPATIDNWSMKKMDAAESNRIISDKEIAWLEYLKAEGNISRGFNWLFFSSGDSVEPEMAGIKGAFIGTALTLLVTLGLSSFLGIAAAIYLEEFAPKNKWTDIIEININNLAAVPSIIFGLLGAAVFLGVFELGRTRAHVGGMVLALMTLPTIIIASRAALKAVPPSIREAAMGIGASKVQTVFHHVLPLAMPGIMTGTIIGMAQALGETAPLLMIGMTAFVADIPSWYDDSATVLPVLIYNWASSAEIGFQNRTAAAILVLLIFLVAMNALAVILRKRFERRW